MEENSTNRNKQPQGESASHEEAQKQVQSSDFVEYLCKMTRCGISPFHTTASSTVILYCLTQRSHVHHKLSYDNMRVVF